MLSGFKISSASFSISSCVLFDSSVLVEVVESECGVEVGVESECGVEVGVESEVEFKA